MKILHSTQNMNKQNQDRSWLPQNYEKVPKHILEHDYKAEWTYGRAFNISIYGNKVCSRYGVQAIFCFFLYTRKISNFSKRRWFLVYIKQYVQLHCNRQFNMRCFNLSYPQKQKILSPLYNFENILLQFSEVIKVNTSMFSKTKGNWRKGEKYEAIYMWSANTLDAPFSRWKSRSYPICIHITYQCDIYKRI